jgi:hypothetical protein
MMQQLEAHAWCELDGVVLNDDLAVVSGFRRVPFPGSQSSSVQA